MSPVQAESPPSSSRAGRLVVLAAFCGVMVSFGSLVVFTFSVFLKPLTAEFGWSRESTSAAFGIAAMTIAVASPFLGRLLDRYGPRPVILPCMIVLGIGIASLAALTPHLWHLYLVFFVIGIVGNGTTQMGYSRAVSSWFTERRGLALALVVAGVGVGSMILPPLAQWLIDQHGWRNAYLVLGCLVLAMGVPLTALFVRERPREAASDRHRTESGSSVGRGLRSRAFWLIVGTLFFSSIAINGVITHFSAILTDRGLTTSQGALALSFLGGLSLTGRLVAGLLLDRFFGPWVSFGLLTGAALGVFLLSSAATPWVAYASAALIGLGLGGEADVTPYLLTRYFGLKSFSTLYGFTWTAYAIAGAAGPILMGRAFDVTGSYANLLTLLAGQTLISGCLALLLPAYRARE